MITRPDIIALTQEYLGCLPVVKDVNLWWSKYTGKISNTQNIHRDYDDFKFLSFFILLTDVDETNGPHVYYPKTHDGSEINSDPKIIYGKKGTAFVTDVFGLHNGMPLEKGKRCLLWCRFGLFLNNMHYYIKNNTYPQEENVIFSKIEKKQKQIALKKALYSSVGLIVVGLLYALAFSTFEGIRDASYSEYEGLLDAVKADRLSMLYSDSFRSIVLIGVGFVVLWLFLKQQLKYTTSIIAFAVLILFDLVIDPSIYWCGSRCKATAVKAFHI